MCACVCVRVLMEQGVPAPRLALDALGGESGRRLLRLLRAGSPLVCYALRSNRLPTLDVSLLLYHQISLHGFSLNQVPNRMRKNVVFFLSAFPMFVPSLSWQNDRLYI